MKKHFFDHDYSARNDQKILQLRFKHGAEGYGIFWMICETMAEDSTGYIQSQDLGGLSLGYGVPIATLSEVINYCVEIGLFKQCEHGNYYSERMLFHRSVMSDFSVSGRKGAEIRWKNRGANAGGNAGGNAKETKGKETKEDNTIALFENFRKKYPGAKRGYQTEFTLFKKHKDWIEILPVLEPAIEREIIYKTNLKSSNSFCPEWPRLSTWINQRRWEEEFTETKAKPSYDPTNPFTMPM